VGNARLNKFKRLPICVTISQSNYDS
jgi:hypothetical protein